MIGKVTNNNMKDRRGNRGRKRNAGTKAKRNGDSGTERDI